MVVQFLTRSVAALGLTILLSGCSLFRSDLKDYEPDDERKVFGLAVRQSAPQPVYSRTRWVHLPQPIPAKGIETTRAGLMLPVIHLDIQDATVEEASKVLASTARYRSYCASTIANRKITLNTLGTIDELAKKIAHEAKVEVFVDHVNKEVRFLGGVGATEPKLSAE